MALLHLEHLLQTFQPLGAFADQETNLPRIVCVPIPLQLLPDDAPQLS